MTQPLNIIKALVENGFDRQQLEQALYHDDALIAYLESIHGIPNYSQMPSAYHELLTEDFARADGRLNVLGIFEKILSAMNVNYQANQATIKDLSFIMDAAPPWLPSHLDYVSALYERHKPLSKAEFKALLLTHFPCLNKRPKWLQGADWIVQDKPLIFVGQLDVSALHHDTTYLYTFFNPDTGAYAYLTQSA